MSDQIIIYQSPDGTTGLEVHLEAETVWLTQDQMAELFGRERWTVITKHLRNVFKEGELEERRQYPCKICTYCPGRENVSDTVLINLDAILSVGYRVNSKRAPNSGSGLPKCCVTILYKGLRLISPG